MCHTHLAHNLERSVEEKKGTRGGGGGGGVQSQAADYLYSLDHTHLRWCEEKESAHKGDGKACSGVHFFFVWSSCD